MVFFPSDAPKGCYCSRVGLKDASLMKIYYYRDVEADQLVAILFSELSLSFCY